MSETPWFVASMNVAMPRADWVSLTAEGLDMPAVDHLSNQGMYDLFLRHLGGLPATKLTNNPKLVGLLVNLSRLTDKALREYDAARAELLTYVTSDRVDVGPLYRAIDHMENCVSATHRAVLNAKALRAQKIGRAARPLTERQEKRLREVRHAIEHSDERLLARSTSKTRPAFGRSDPFSLRPANTSLVIGNHVLPYRDLVSAMTKCHKTIEVIRGVPPGDPGQNYLPNAVLRTTSPSITLAPGARISDYLKELMRLGITHA